MMNKKYNIYFDPEIEGNDIVVCGIDDFKFGDRLCLINLFHITSGIVKSQIPETPDKPSGLYVGIMLSMELGIDTDGDVINVFDIDVVKINHPSTNSLNIEFRSNDPVIHNVILEQMAISLEKSEDRKKMNIAIYNHYERRIMFENTAFRFTRKSLRIFFSISLLLEHNVLVIDLALGDDWKIPEFSNCIHSFTFFFF